MNEIKSFISFIGGIVPEVSWPLSRFEKGKTEVTISFAVKGAADLTAVRCYSLLHLCSLCKNGEL